MIGFSIYWPFCVWFAAVARVRCETGTHVPTVHTRVPTVPLPKWSPLFSTNVYNMDYECRHCTYFSGRSVSAGKKKREVPLLGVIWGVGNSFFLSCKTHSLLKGERKRSCIYIHIPTLYMCFRKKHVWSNTFTE